MRRSHGKKGPRAAPLSLLVLLAACSGNPSQTGAVLPRSGEPDEVVVSQPRVSIEDFAYVLGTSTDDISQRTTPAEYRQWVRDRLGEPEMYHQFMANFSPALLGNKAGVASWLFEAKSDKGRMYLYAKDECKDADLVEAQPWWAPEETVLICEDHYYPERTLGKNGIVYCDTTWGPVHPDEECGCGPNLMFCAPYEMTFQLAAALREEVRETVRDIVASRRPFSDVFSFSESYRSGVADFWYNRVEFFQTGEFKIPDLNQPLRKVTRPAYFDAGVLTTLQSLFFDGPRSMTDLTWHDFLCVELRSASVTTHRVLEVAQGLGKGVSDVRAEVVMPLASTEGCQDCHAKLEYGTVPRQQWLPAFYGQHMNKSAKTAETTKFYLNNHLDLRGEGPATLSWIGSMISAQPEFAECMSKRMANWVYEGAMPSPKVVELLRQQFVKSEDIAQVIEDAVIARAFGAQALQGN